MTIGMVSAQAINTSRIISVFSVRRVGSFFWQKKPATQIACVF